VVDLELELLPAEADESDKGEELVSLETFQEEQRDTEALGSAYVAGHWTHGSLGRFVAAKDMAQDTVMGTAYFLDPRGG
jgi:hypothetical protein